MICWKNAEICLKQYVENNAKQMLQQCWKDDKLCWNRLKDDDSLTEQLMRVYRMQQITNLSSIEVLGQLIVFAESKSCAPIN